jgi:hypothetical protein
MTYDVIIIGSGIAGLYAAYKIRQSSPETNYLVLEKKSKTYIGGRASNELFYGTSIVTGAGIGRKRDKLLKSLYIELGFEIKEFKSVTTYSSLVEPLDVLKTLKQLREEYKGPPTTFEKFAKPILGEDVYKRFLYSSGYTDYEKADAYDTLYNYSMEDNAGHLTGFGVQWHKMILAIVDRIGKSNIKFHQNVIKILPSCRENDGSSHTYELETETGMKYVCRKVIVATTISGLRTLFPKHPIYREVEGQPFLRMYGKFTKQSLPILDEYAGRYIVVPGLIQKMIAMNREDGVYMIVYNDNKNTLKLKDRLENTESNREYYCKLIERSLGIPSNKHLHLIGIRSFYWKVGTHYYKPLNPQKYANRDEFIRDAQHPAKNLFVVGEVVSKHQGWTEGALESVEQIFRKN